MSVRTSLLGESQRLKLSCAPLGLRLKPPQAFSSLFLRSPTSRPPIHPSGMNTWDSLKPVTSTISGTRRWPHSINVSEMNHLNPPTRRFSRKHVLTSSPSRPQALPYPISYDNYCPKRWIFVHSSQSPVSLPRQEPARCPPRPHLSLNIDFAEARGHAPSQLSIQGLPPPLPRSAKRYRNMAK